MPFEFVQASIPQTIYTMEGNKNTAKKIIRLAFFGFLIGIVIGDLIAVLTGSGEKGQFIPVSQELLRKAGSVRGAIFFHQLASGLLGAVAMAGSIFYEFDNWEMSKAAVTHFLIILAAYFAAAFFCGWIEPKAEDILIMTAIMAAAYFLVWLIMYLRCRRETEKLNEELRSKK